MNNPARTAALAVFDAINTGELAVLDALVTQDFVDHGSPFPLPPGPAGYRQILTFVHHVLNIRYTLEDVFDTDDRVVIRATAAGIGVDAIHGQGADGKPYRMTTVHIFRTEGPLLAEHWGVRDELGTRIQLGTLPAPDPAAFAPQGS